MKTLFIALLLTLLASTGFARNYSYKCYSFYWNGYNHLSGTMSLTVNAQQAKADIQHESWDEDLGGSLDRNYKPRGSTNFVRYGSNLILEDVLVLGGKKLNDGRLGGIARVEGQAEGGFYQYKFICKR